MIRALNSSSLNYQSTPNKMILEKTWFLFGFIFNDLPSLKMAANFHKNWPYAAEALNNLIKGKIGVSVFRGFAQGLPGHQFQGFEQGVFGTQQVGLKIQAAGCNKEFPV